MRGWDVVGTIHLNLESKKQQIPKHRPASAGRRCSRRTYVSWQSRTVPDCVKSQTCRAWSPGVSYQRPIWLIARANWNRCPSDEISKGVNVWSSYLIKYFPTQGRVHCRSVADGIILLCPPIIKPDYSQAKSEQSPFTQCRHFSSLVRAKLKTHNFVAFC